MPFLFQPPLKVLRVGLNYNFLCQISANDLPDELQDLFYLNDAVGYIFLKNNLDSGIFFVQTT
jgi:hypothetical protein